MSKRNKWLQRHISKSKNTLEYTLKDLKEQTKDQLLLLTFSCIDDMSCDKKEDKNICNCAGHHEKLKIQNWKGKLYKVSLTDRRLVNLRLELSLI